jgi:hypothetical protein
MTRPLRRRSTDSLAIAPATVSDRTAPLVLGLEPRVYRDLVARLRIRHARLGRRVIARVEDVLAALDRIAEAHDAMPEASPEPVGDEPEPETVDQVLRRQGRRRTE